jgi:ring-1,2-phenylacetyl-CoA epoxidase subunit PaaA
MDRAAGHQLEDTLESSYNPWKEAIGGIYKEEVMHIAHGDKWIKKLAADSERKDFLQERLNLWWPRVMNVFGSSKGAANDIYVRLGLKNRSNAEIREVFKKEVLGLTKSWGLEIPRYDETIQKK